MDNGAFLVPSGNPITWSVMYTDAVTCSDEARSSSEASMYTLAYNPATPIDPQPLYTVIGKRLDKIAIDVVVNYNGENQTVIFFSTMDGEIHQLVQGASRRQEVLIKNVGRQLGHLTVHKNADETRSLLVATENQLMLISLGDCSRYSDCFACLDSNEAYCGWDSDTSSCINKVATNSANVLQSALSTENETVDVCGPRPESTAPTTICETTDQSITPYSGGLGIPLNTVSVPDLVGATVGAFVVGIPVGAFVCFLLLKLFIAPRKRKHRRSHQGQTDTVIAANNLTHNAQQIKKDIPIKENSAKRYVDHTPSASQPETIPEKNIILEPPPIGNAHKRKNSKDINTMVSPEKSEIIDEPDHLPPLRSISSASLHSYNKRNGYPYNGIQRKQVPGYRVPRGRTDSTTWLRANSVSSEPPSPFTPLDSPISDV